MDGGPVRAHDPADEMKLSTTDPAGMTAGQINRELDKLEKLRDAITSEFIATGRGHERPSETDTMSDPLALRDHALRSRFSALHGEIDRRYGPGAPYRLPPGRMFGPIKGNLPVNRSALITLAGLPHGYNLAEMGEPAFNHALLPMLRTGHVTLKQATPKSRPRFHLTAKGRASIKEKPTMKTKRNAPRMFAVYSGFDSQRTAPRLIHAPTAFAAANAYLSKFLARGYCTLKPGEAETRNTWRFNYVYPDGGKGGTIWASTDISMVKTNPATITTRDGTTYTRTAWTGGDTVSAQVAASRPFRQLQAAFYQEQLTDWKNYWGDLPDADTRKIFIGRARADAWATLRDIKTNPVRGRGRVLRYRTVGTGKKRLTCAVVSQRGPRGGRTVCHAAKENPSLKPMKMTNDDLQFLAIARQARADLMTPGKSYKNPYYSSSDNGGAYVLGAWDAYHHASRDGVQYIHKSRGYTWIIETGNFHRLHVEVVNDADHREGVRVIGYVKEPAASRTKTNPGRAVSGSLTYVSYQGRHGRKWVSRAPNGHLRLIDGYDRAQAFDLGRARRIRNALAKKYGAGFTLVTA